MAEPGEVCVYQFKVSQEGSHRQYKHPTKQGRVTIAGHPGDDISIDNRKSIFRQAQLKDKR